MEKKEFWSSLSDFLAAKSPSNVILARDLNITLAPNEKKGGIVGKDHFQGLVEALIQIWDLINFKPKKGRFTWSNNRTEEANIAARLDRYLVNSCLMDGNVIT